MVVIGGFFKATYAQAVLLQFGTAALLLVPILLVERSIGLRLSRQIDDQSVIWKAEAALDLDDIWRDFGQKISGTVAARPLAEIESVLAGRGWTHYRTLDGYRLWRSDTQALALPDTPDAPVPAPHVRAELRVLNITHEQYEQEAS